MVAYHDAATMALDPAVLSRDHGEWWYVRLADGQCGYLPGSYVRLASAAAGSGGDAASSEASSRASPASSHGSMSRSVSRAADKKKQQQQRPRPPPTLEEPEPEREVEAPKPGWAPQGEVEELQAELSKTKQKMKILKLATS